MKLGIIVNTDDAETAWNALRLGNEALAEGHESTMFLLGKGVEMVKIENTDFDIGEGMQKFLGGGGNLLACGTCLSARNQEAGVCSISTMSELLRVTSDSDRVVTLG